MKRGVYENKETIRSSLANLAPMYFYLRRKPTGHGTVDVVVVVVVVVLLLLLLLVVTTFEFRKLCIFQQNGKNKSCRSHRAEQLFLLSGHFDLLNDLKSQI